MPKPYTLRKILSVLKKLGFERVSQKGSHAKFINKKSPHLIVIVPVHGKEIPYGTFRSILRQAQLSEKDFQ